MHKLMIKIGGDMDKDIDEVFKNPAIAYKRPDHTIYLNSIKQVFNILTPKRLELLMHLIETQKKRKSITQLAKELKRKQEAISRDISFLEGFNIIDKKREKKNIFVFTPYDSIEIKLTAEQ